MTETPAKNAKLVQYLNEANAKEKELEAALAAHISMSEMADRKPYRKRLQEHGVRAGFSRAGQDSGTALGSDDQDRNISRGAISAQYVAERKTVHEGQIQLGDDQRRCANERLYKRIAAIRRLNNIPSAPCADFSVDCSRVGVGIRDEQPPRAKSGR